ncbi:MAG: hypothetical protein N3A38_04040 [Planctomycetota bacterium]|nr:hypothetical protein [Planctomycetota bacterium]
MISRRAAPGAAAVRGAPGRVLRKEGREDGLTFAAGTGNAPARRLVLAVDTDSNVYALRLDLAAAAGRKGP